MQKIQTFIATNRIIRNVIACILGYSLWRSIHHELPQTVTLSVPLVFYNTEQAVISAPEATTITLSGKHKHIKTLTSELTAYINADTLEQQKTTLLELANHHLLLPKHYSLVSYKPVLVTKTKLS